MNLKHLYWIIPCWILSFLFTLAIQWPGIYFAYKMLAR